MPLVFLQRDLGTNVTNCNPSSLTNFYKPDFHQCQWRWIRRWNPPSWGRSQPSSFCGRLWRLDSWIQRRPAITRNCSWTIACVGMSLTADRCSALRSWCAPLTHCNEPGRVGQLHTVCAMPRNRDGDKILFDDFKYFFYFFKLNCIFWRHLNFKNQELCWIYWYWKGQQPLSSSSKGRLI